MKIYTKGGDQGETQIYADKVLRMSKDADVLECYGTLDELNAHTGLLLSQLRHENLEQLNDTHHLLEKVQQHLFQIGFAISATTLLGQRDLTQLEQSIDKMQSTLAPQTSFILPGGSLPAAQAHICRTVARRAERRLVKLRSSYQVPSLCIAYINRLSDYFFVVARYINHLMQLPEKGL